MPVAPTFPEALLQRLHLLPTPMLDAFAAPLFGRVLALATRRGVFEALAGGPASAPDVAVRCGFHPDAAPLVLDACVTCGYLRRTDARYRLAPPARRWLLRSSPRNLVRLVAYFESRAARWADLETALSTGAPATTYQSGLDADGWELYVDAMADLARFLIPAVLRRIRLPGSPRSGLDLGGSHGLYAAALCRAHPHLTMTVLDDPRAQDAARRSLAGVAGADRVSVRPADVLRDPLPGGQDVILLFNLIHGFTAEQNTELLRRTLAALAPGGRAYILDQFLGERGTGGAGSFIPLMMGLHLLNESGGRTFAVEEVRAWCRDSADVRRLGLGLPGVGLVELIRPR